MNAIEKTISWEIQQNQVYANGLIIPNYQAITRNDNNHTLYVAKQSYSPTYNARLIEVTEKLHQLTGYEIKGYTEFKGGSKVLGFLKASEDSDLLGWNVQDYMVIGNSHDGSSGFFVGTSSVMLRCMNQWGKINQKMKVYHTKNHDVRIEEIIRYFEGFTAERRRVQEKLVEFSRIKIDEKIITALAERLLNIGNKEERSARKQNLLDAFMGSVNGEIKDLGKNALGLFQGVTHYTTHIRNTKETVFGNIIGEAAVINRKAFEFCNELVTA